MPSVSGAQQRFMAACRHNPQHMAGKCPDMTPAQYHDFDATKTKGLPEHKKKIGIGSLKKK